MLVFHARVEMASARVVGAAKSLDARVKAIIQAVPYCFLESREHELGTVKPSMELRHVFCDTCGVAVGGIGGMPGR